MPLDHLGIAVPDLARAREYYDALAPLVGFEPFGAGEDWVGYWPTGGGTQLFLYAADEPARPQHLAFRVETRRRVEAAHAWAVARGDEVLHAPQLFPTYHPDHYATYWRELHGLKLEVVAFEHPG